MTGRTVLLVAVVVAGVVGFALWFQVVLSTNTEFSHRLVVPMVGRDAPDSRVYLPTATPVPPVYPCSVHPQDPASGGRILGAWVVEDAPESILIGVDYEWNDASSPVCIAIYLFDGPFPGANSRGTAGQLPQVPAGSKGTVLIRATCAEMRFQGVAGGAYFAAGFFTNAPPFYRVPVVGVLASLKQCL